jgi:hypothetical protein
MKKSPILSSLLPTIGFFVAAFATQSSPAFAARQSFLNGIAGYYKLSGQSCSFGDFQHEGGARVDATKSGVVVSFKGSIADFEQTIRYPFYRGTVDQRPKAKLAWKTSEKKRESVTSEFTSSGKSARPAAVHTLRKIAEDQLIVINEQDGAVTDCVLTRDDSDAE